MIADKKYFGWVSYLVSLVVVCAAVWIWVGIWILAVIPQVVFGAFFLSVLADTVWLMLCRAASARRMKNVVFSNFSALAATGVLLAVLHVVLG